VGMNLLGMPRIIQGEVSSSDLKMEIITKMTRDLNNTNFYQSIYSLVEIVCVTMSLYNLD
jgi:hypothetical protein